MFRRWLRKTEKERERSRERRNPGRWRERRGIYDKRTRGEERGR